MKISKMLVAGVVMAGMAVQSSAMTVTEWCGQLSKDGGKTFYVNADTEKINKSLKIEFTPAEAAGDWSQIYIGKYDDVGKSIGSPWSGKIQDVIQNGALITTFFPPPVSSFTAGNYKLRVNLQYKIVMTQPIPSALPIENVVDYTPASVKPTEDSFTVKAYSPATITANISADSANTTINPSNEDEGLSGEVYAAVGIGSDIYVINPDLKSATAYIPGAKIAPVYSGKLTANMTVKLWGTISNDVRAALKNAGAILYVGYGAGTGVAANADMLKADNRLPIGSPFVNDARLVTAITSW